MTRYINFRYVYAPDRHTAIQTALKLMAHEEGFPTHGRRNIYATPVSIYRYGCIPKSEWCVAVYEKKPTLKRGTPVSVRYIFPDGEKVVPGFIIKKSGNQPDTYWVSCQGTDLFVHDSSITTGDTR